MAGKSRTASGARPLLATYWGVALGVVAIAIWAMTFEPHGGPELSWFLFPLARLVLEAVLPHQSIPPAIWFGSAWLQWVALGGAVDLFRMLRRRRAAARTKGVQWERGNR